MAPPSVLVWVVLPRLGLLAANALARWRLGRAFPMPMASAYFTSWRAFRANLRPILLLAVGAVAFTTGIVAVVLGIAILTLASKVQVPFWPVPMTLHTLAVFLVAAALGSRLGLAAMAAYLANDESAYVTGSEFHIDGGILAGSAASPE
mgnify:CR=1 FL=1